MTEWVEWSEAEAAGKWDVALTALPGANFYQSCGWGDFKRRSGWGIRRGTLLLSGTPAAMAQCLVREWEALRMVVVWVPGGPAGNSAGCLALGEALQRRYQGWSMCLRTNILAEARPETRTDMEAAGWMRADVSVGHPLTFHLDLSPDEPTRRRALSANWRHNLVRGERRGSEVKVWPSTEPLEPVYDVYRETGHLKGLAEGLSLDDFQAMRVALGESFTLAVALGEGGEPCAIRGFGRIGELAQDLVAGVSRIGRRQYANYPLMWFLLALARQKGARLYDLSGADPKGAPGVFDFKKGLGGRLVSLVGEWDWSNRSWFRWCVNTAIRCRGGRL